MNSKLENKLYQKLANNFYCKYFKTNLFQISLTGEGVHLQHLKKIGFGTFFFLTLFIRLNQTPKPISLMLILKCLLGCGRFLSLVVGN